MATATDAQMQAFCDQRLRPRAEELRDLLNQMTDDKANIGDEYARATSVTHRPGRLAANQPGERR